MGNIRLTIDTQSVEAAPTATILEAARAADVYIPTLCHHPDLAPADGSRAVDAIYQGEARIENTNPGEEGKGCGLCVVEVAGEAELVRACATTVREGMVIHTRNQRIEEKRREHLLPILARHRHACLTCAQQEGCSRSQCSANVPENERCCTQFGHCELQDVTNHVGISPQTPKWMPTDLPVLGDDPLFVRDYNLCIGCTRCVRACRELRGIEAIGFVHDAEGRVQVGTLAPTLMESHCKFCTACVAVCPTGALQDKKTGAGAKAGEMVPCRAACPAGIDVPEYLRFIARGDNTAAQAVIREKVPFPGVLGRVCLHPCEDACRRGEVDAPVSICALKRFAADNAFWEKKTQPLMIADTGKRVAVVGAGPAGLTAAFYLRKKGHAVTLFDAEAKAGGMMRHGIPAYRLPGEVLDREIQDILDTGVEFRPHHRLGVDFTLKQLKDKGYDAVFMGMGAPLGRNIALEGCDGPDVISGVAFLKQVSQGEAVSLKENVVVIGGGNVAVDVALTALRCGAMQVYMACLECEAEMPASPEEIDAAVAEGVILLPARGPDRIITEGDRVTGLDIKECTGVFDEKGNFCPRFNEENTECLLVNQVILAVGQASDLSFLEQEKPIRVHDGWVVVNEETRETHMAGVYAGGDVTGMKGAVIHAVADGRRAAAAMDKALGGDGDIDEVLVERPVPNHHLGRDEGFTGRPREKMPETGLQCRKGFSEIATGYDAAQAVREAKRCLQCDLRLLLGRNPPPPVSVFDFDEVQIRTVPESEGVFRLLDESRAVLTIKGTDNLRNELLQQLESNEKGAFFTFEEDKMYTRRESELIQQYLQEHGEMPGGGEDDLDDLF